MIVIKGNRVVVGRLKIDVERGPRGAIPRREQWKIKFSASIFKFNHVNYF